MCDRCVIYLNGWYDGWFSSSLIIGTWNLTTCYSMHWVISSWQTSVLAWEWIRYPNSVLINRSISYSVIWSDSQSISQSKCLSQSISSLLTQSISESVVNQSVANQSVNKSVICSVNQSVANSVNQYVSQPVNQSISWTHKQAVIYYAFKKLIFPIYFFDFFKILS